MILKTFFAKVGKIELLTNWDILCIKTNEQTILFPMPLAETSMNFKILQIEND